MSEFEFIGNYQVSSLLASSYYCELYEARPKEAQSTVPVILAFWPELEISGSEEVNTFQQKVRQGSIRSGVQAIPILDADFDKGHPYIVTPYSLDMLDNWRKHAFFIDQTLREVQRVHPDDAHLFTNTFLDILMGAPIEAEPTVPVSSFKQDYPTPAFNDQAYSAATVSDLPYVASSTPVGDRPPFSPPPVSQRKARWYQADAFALPIGSKRKVKWYQVALLVLLLILLIWGGTALYAVVPASAATITITPMKQRFTQNYSFGVVTGTPELFEIQGRQITATSQRFSKTVAATGKGHHNATAAKGTVVISQIQLTNPSAPGNLAIFTLSDANGLQFTSDNEVSLPQGGSVSVPAHITQAGSVGNIPADDVDGPIVLINSITQAQDGTAFVSNPAPFTGGTDARDFTFVQQSDLDHVTTPFVTKVTSATQNNVTKQIKADEHLATDMQCTPGVSANHRVNSEAGDVTVQVNLTCKGLVYSDQTIHDAATSAYQKDGTTKFGVGYDVVGNMVMGTITKSNVNNDPQLVFSMDGIWSFQYTQAHKQDIERLIAGKSQDAARLLLHARKDMQTVAISTSGFPGSALPSSPASISIVAKKVTGL